MSKDDLKDSVVRNALTWKGTKYFFGQCVKGVGADCATFVIGVFIESGILPKPFRMSRRYNRQATAHLPESAFVYELEKTSLFKKVWDAKSDAYPPAVEKGDLIIFRRRDSGDGHVGLCTEQGLFIHCNEKGGVQEERLVKQSIGSVWRYKEWVG